MDVNYEMTLFADTLKRYLEDKKTTIYNISKISGVNRTMLQRMKSAERFPKDEETVQALANAMRLNPAESNELIRAYRITKMGEENYLRREHVKNIVSGFFDTTLVSEMLIQSNTHQGLKLANNIEVISGQANVHRLLKAVLEIEANKKTGHIRILIQPEFAYLFECLASIDFNKNQTTVEIIITFDKNEEYGSTSYNLNILKELVPCLFQCDTLLPYYVYDNVNSIYNKTSFMPYKIITSDYSLFISYDQNEAMISASSQMLALANDNFNKKLHTAKPIFHAYHPDPQKYLEASLLGEDELNTNQNYGLMYQPCFPSFCPDDILIDRLNKELLPIEMMEHIVAYFGKIRDTSNFYQSFTLEGLRLFMDTGKVTEIPDFMYTYLTERQRITLLRNIVASTDKGAFHPRIIKSELFTVPLPIDIVSPTEQTVYIYYFSQTKGIYVFHLHELGLVHAFHDFLEYLTGSELVYSADETKKLLHQVLEEYEAKFLGK